MSEMVSKTPGILLCVVIALLAIGMQHFIINPIEPIIIAMIFGMLLGNLMPINDFFKEGLQFTAKKLLPLGIILLGSQLNLFTVAKISLHALWVSVLCIIVAFTVTIFLCRLAKINPHMGILIGVGTAICGSTAIVVTAPVIKAKETEIAIAIATITLFGSIAIFLYPALGHLLQLTPWQFGVWAGTAIQAVPQVVAAAFTYSHQSGMIGTVVKLVRVLLLAPMLIALSIWQFRREKLTRAVEQVEKSRWTNFVPPFILGFIAFVILSTFGVFRNFQVAGIAINTSLLLKQISIFLLIMAMAAIGFGTQFKAFIHTGIKPLFIGFICATILGIFSLVLII